MILNRVGNKEYLVKHSNILSLFPPHEIFIDMFFGAGGVFFNKKKAKYNICNDLDDDVYNLYRVVRDHKDELVEELLITPQHYSLFKHWLVNKETNPIKKAVRFLILSNTSLYGKGNYMRIGLMNSRKLILENISRTFEFILEAQFTNYDFRKVLKSVSLKGSDRDKVFVYADPPYLGTSNNYNTKQFSPKDTEDLFELLVNSNMSFAISERNNPLILELSSKFNLTVIYLMGKVAIKSRQTEILIINYPIPQTLF